MTTDHTYRGYEVDIVFLGKGWQAWFAKNGYWPTWTTGWIDTLDETIETVHAMIDDLHLPARLKQTTH